MRWHIKVLRGRLLACSRRHRTHRLARVHPIARHKTQYNWPPGCRAHRGVELEGGVRRVDAGAALCAVLGKRGVGGTVCAHEELGAARLDSAQESLSVCLVLQHREAVHVWPEAAFKKGVAVVQEVVGGDGGGNQWSLREHKIDGFFRSNVLQNNFKSRVLLDQRYEDA